MQKNFDEKFESLSKTPTFADITKTGLEANGDFINNLAKEVVDKQKKLTHDREEREKNIIIFNGPSQNPDEADQDSTFFNSMCEDVLGLKKTEIEISRIPTKNSDKSKPIKVRFATTWDKRKFMASLPKLRQSDFYKSISIAHDMSPEDRKKNK